MKIHDISMPIHEAMLVYKNYDHKKPKVVNVANHSDSSHYETDVTLNLHTGTHIDAPLHMIDGGDTMEAYDLSRFITQARVIDLTHVDGMIHESDLVDKEIQKGEFLIFKTRNSFEDFFNLEYISLAEDGAKYLAQFELNGVGIDALGIERAQANHMTHIRLMNSGAIILEGLQLKDVEVGTYQLIALPISIQNVEASLTRAVLIEE